MTDKWYVLWWRFLRQVFCWHNLVWAESECIHAACSKCGYQFTDWQAKWELEFNLRAEIQHRYDALVNDEILPSARCFLGNRLHVSHEPVLRRIVEDSVSRYLQSCGSPSDPYDPWPKIS